MCCTTNDGQADVLNKKSSNLLVEQVNDNNQAKVNKRHGSDPVKETKRQREERIRREKKESNAEDLYEEEQMQGKHQVQTNKKTFI